MDIRCINEHGKVRYIPEHLANNAEYMKNVGLRIEDIRLVGTKEVKGKSEEPVNVIDTIADEEIIKPATDLIEEKEKEEANAFTDFAEKKTRKRKQK